MTFLSLFSGIGGFDLGLERAGMRCIGQVEIDPFCRRVLAKHWPNVPRFEDVKKFKSEMLNERPDVICGGFPCQDISEAGLRAGITGSRSGLWTEFTRIICEIRPSVVIVENVSDLLVRGIGTVLGDLAELGFDAEWHLLSASAFGAPHPRERVFIVGLSWWNVANADGCIGKQTRSRHGAAGSRGWWAKSRLANFRHDVPASILFDSASSSPRQGWATEPDVRRVGNGIPNRVERITALGNAVLPQAVEFIGRGVVEAKRFFG